MSVRSPRFWAVIPAAGGGARMGGRKPKQYLDLCGRTLLEWSIRPFLEAGWIDGVVLVLARADAGFAPLGLSGHPRILIATGGSARADSVLAGLDVVAARSAGFREVFVLVHDAARPGVEGADLQRLRDEGSDENGAILALPVTDTLKAGDQGRITATVDRSPLWRAQTPQLFRLDLLRQALQGCLAQQVEITDEAGAMERAGRKPRLVRGRECNLKVTYPEDLPLAEFWLRQAGRAR